LRSKFYNKKSIEIKYNGYNRKEMSSEWLQFVKFFIEKNSHLSYKEAIKQAEEPYRNLKAYFEQKGGSGKVKEEKEDNDDVDRYVQQRVKEDSVKRFNANMRHEEIYGVDDGIEIEECVIEGKIYLKDTEGTIYDAETEEKVGKYDFKKKKWINENKRFNVKSDFDSFFNSSVAAPSKAAAKPAKPAVSASAKPLAPPVAHVAAPAKASAKPLAPHVAAPAVSASAKPLEPPVAAHAAPAVSALAPPLAPSVAHLAAPLAAPVAAPVNLEPYITAYLDLYGKILQRQLNEPQRKQVGDVFRERLATIGQPIISIYGVGYATQGGGGFNSFVITNMGIYKITCRAGVGGDRLSKPIHIYQFTNELTPVVRSIFESYCREPYFDWDAPGYVGPTRYYDFSKRFQALYRGIPGQGLGEDSRALIFE